jgi:glycosyltransferase involved in cell wall biosynthesis
MRKALIITYYWPPTGGSGVQRWLKFAKYFRDFGWEPLIYTPENPEAPVLDESLKKDLPKNLTVIRRKIIEPYSLFRLITGRKSSMGAGFTSSEKKGKSWLNSLTIWIRGNLFIPDPRILWVKPSIRFLKKYLEANPVDAIITTGPPHSMHLIGLGLKKRINISWIADFRDPWTKIDFVDDLKLTRRSQKKHCSLEKKVAENADGVVVVSQKMKSDFEKYGLNHIEVITNGFDDDDFPPERVAPDTKFSITHIGSIPANRNCSNLWKALGLMARKHSDFSANLSIQLVGSVDLSVITDIETYGLAKHCQNFGYLSHAEAIKVMLRSQVLLLLVNNSLNAEGILTGKVFEYFAAQRPILAIAPKGGELDQMITSTKSGVVASFNNQREIEESIEWLWQHYKTEFNDFSPESTELFSRKSITESMIKLLNRIIRQ